MPKHTQVDRKELFEETLKSMRLPQASETEASWMKLQQRIGAEERTPIVHINRRRVPAWAAAAAVLVLVVGALALFSGGSTETGSVTAMAYETAILPDGSEVRLAPGARIDYSIEQGGERIINLTGEAFFEVTKGERFVVNTTAGQVEVLGTSFTVFAAEEQFSVECVTGKVAVSAGESKQHITAGQAVKKRNGTLCAPYAHNQTGNALGSDERSYTNADLNRVFQHVEQHFNVTVRLQGDLAGKEFSGSFVMRDAESTLRIITRAMNLDLEQVDATTYTVSAAD